MPIDLKFDVDMCCAPLVPVRIDGVEIVYTLCICEMISTRISVAWGVTGHEPPLKVSQPMQLNSTVTSFELSCLVILTPRVKCVATFRSGGVCFVGPHSGGSRVISDFIKKLHNLLFLIDISNFRSGAYGIGMPAIARPLVDNGYMRCRDAERRSDDARVESVMGAGFIFQAGCVGSKAGLAG